jgi:hypothetical protein
MLSVAGAAVIVKVVVPDTVTQLPVRALPELSVIE